MMLPNEQNQWWLSAIRWSVSFGNSQDDFLFLGPRHRFYGNREFQEEVNIPFRADLLELIRK
jgi:hypothetical protein